MSFVDFREVSSPAAGTTTKYGSQDLLDIMQIFNGKVVGTKRPRITNEWLFQIAFDLTEVSPPASPTAGNQRIYIDSTDHKLKRKNSAGTITDIEGAGGGGGNVSTTSSNTYGDFDQIFRSGRLDVMNPANTFSYSITGSAIAANRALTLPLLAADDTVTTLAFTQTLTNKTISDDLNTINDSTTNAAGDILKNNGTKFVRLARGTANQVLTVNAGATDVSWAAPAAGGGNVSTTTTNTFGAFDNIFRSSNLKLTNPANTFNYAFVGSAIAAARNVTLPLLTADDNLVTEAFTQTVTNKTINATNNTVTDTSTATGDLMVSNGTKFIRRAKGTGLQILRTNSGATDLEWATLDNERIGKSTASGNGATTTFNIAHGIGANPTYAIVSVAQSGTSNLTYSYTTDATNIIVVFTTAPSSGASNVVIYWIAVA